MSPSDQHRRDDALAIWQAGVAAVQPATCVPAGLEETFGRATGMVGDHARTELPELVVRGSPDPAPDRILVVGGGKAGAAMSLALETALSARGVDLKRVSGVVCVPNETVIPLKAIRLHPARPMGTNQPTEAAMRGALEILNLATNAGPNDLLICLISGGGSALLPAPVEGITLEDKQAVTVLLHRCGATIQEMNAVRKHLSRIKGGGLARTFRGRRLLSLIISDVVGDPLDVIASGPTGVDPTTFADAIAVLHRFGVWNEAPATVRAYLTAGEKGQHPETLKSLPLDETGRPRVSNHIIANSAMALAAAEAEAQRCGYAVMNLGIVEGDTRAAAERMAALAHEKAPAGPMAILSGGETTVTLPKEHGLGGRNQEFVLAFLQKLGEANLKGITILCGGTDGEDGPTDAAGAIGDQALLREARQRGLDPAAFLAGHDAYHFFAPLGGLVKTGPTNTNVMDLRVVLMG
jgi:hydroxypyruvate reductase/glycerate 2-kinase